MSKKNNKPQSPVKQKSSKKPQKELDFQSRNKKVALKRGENWKKSLIRAKNLKARKAGVVLRKTRAESGVSQRSMASLLGFQFNNSYSRIERALMPVSEKTALKISSKLKKPVNTLFQKDRETGAFFAK